MKRIIFCMTYLMLFAVTAGLMAQETKKEEKKVVIVKKTVDDNGKVTEIRKEASGAEADELLKEMKADGQDIEIDIEMDEDGKTEKRIEKKIIKLKGDKDSDAIENLEVQHKMVDGKSVKSYKLTRTVNGETEVIEWDGTGEMPAELKEQMEIMEEIHDGTHKIKIKSKGGKGHDVMMWKEKGSNEEIHLDHNKFVFKEKKENTNKVSLGVMISSDEIGVLVEEVMEGSAAEKAGMKAGDRITEINEKPIGDIDGLLEALSEYNPGDEINVRFIRDGKAQNAKAKLQERK